MNNIMSIKEGLGGSKAIVTKPGERAERERADRETQERAREKQRATAERKG